MKIAINLVPFSSVQGVEIYSQNIIERLLESGNDEFFSFATNDLPKILEYNQLKKIKINISKKYTKALWQQINIYNFLKKHGADLLFSPVPSAPFFYKNKVVTIHDCAYDRFPEFDNFLSRLYFRIMYYGAKYFSKKIITISDFSKNELIGLYKINPNKIEVVYCGVPTLLPVDDGTINKILEKFKIKNPYFIYVGNNRPRKNIIGLVKAFKLFLENTKQNFSLIVAGRLDKRFVDLQEEIKKEKMENKVILTGFIDEKEKTALYKKADALCFPSFYEGFGLPILEAQSLGIPVLTSNTSSMPEIAGKGAIYVNPYDINDIAMAMEEVTKNINLREELVKNGLKNIKRFSWEESGKKILKIFHENSPNK